MNQADFRLPRRNLKGAVKRASERKKTLLDDLYGAARGSGNDRSAEYGAVGSIAMSGGRNSVAGVWLLAITGMRNGRFATFRFVCWRRDRFLTAG